MKSVFNFALLVALVGIVGCTNTTDTQDADDTNDNQTNVTANNNQYVAETEPANATPVGQARENAKDGDAVTLVGHIGGSREPFVEGIAAFTIVDPKVNYCPPEEGCPTPWDYCCTQNEVKENIATIKFVDDKGSPVSKDAKDLLGVKELSLVVVEGTAKRDDQGNLSVLASKIFVKN